MEFNNRIEITMNSNEDANTALNTIKNVLREGNYSNNYTTNTSLELSANLAVNGNEIFLEDGSYFIPEDIATVLEDMMKAVAENPNIIEFKCASFSDSTYSEEVFDAIYKDGQLTIEDTYYPYGFVETLYCEECDTEIVKLADFDPNKEYVCPECGEIIDLSEQYENYAPVIGKKEFIIK